MSASTGLSLSDFTAYELPTKKWMKLVRPKMRLRVRGKRRNFVSSVVKADNRGPNAGTDISRTHWAWNYLDVIRGLDEGLIDELAPRPSFADDDVFEIVIERRFLLGFKCIRRTKSVTVGQVRTVYHDRCMLMLSLYDGQYSATELEVENRIEIGKIAFTLVETSGRFV